MPHQMKDGAKYAPVGKVDRVVQPGEFKFAIVQPEHGHIGGMNNGLVEAGAEIKWVYDSRSEKAQQAAKEYGGEIADSMEQVLADDEVKLVLSSAIASERAGIGIQVMNAGKDYFVDKAPVTTREQYEAVRAAAEKRGRIFAVYFSERLHVGAATYGMQLIKQGAIGDVVSVDILAPHRLNKDKRPDWFFNRAQYGGILTDIGSHQFEQFLAYTGADTAEVVASAVGNYNNPDKPELEDFGQALLQADNGARGYVRVDWFTPDGLPTWGDGRVFVVGTQGSLELRKYLDVGQSKNLDTVVLVDGEGVKKQSVHGEVGFPYFGQLVKDVMNRTETAMTQEHVWNTIDLTLRAQEQAKNVTPDTLKVK